jgi:hypothetical protein
MKEKRIEQQNILTIPSLIILLINIVQFSPNPTIHYFPIMKNYLRCSMKEALKG